MQTMGVSFDGEWESISKLFSVEDEDTNISHNNLFDYSNNLSFKSTPSSFSYETNYPSNYGLPPNYSSQDASYNIMPSINDFPGANDISLCMDFSNSENDGNSLAFLFLENMSNEPNVTPGEGTSSTQVIDNVGDDSKSSNLSSPITELTLKRKPREEEKSSSFTTPKKKARVSRNAQKGKLKVQPKKDEEMIPSVDAKEEVTGMQSMGCGNSEEESNATEEINETAESESSKSVSVTTTTGKKRASRGAATDPQSLYARRRRMRINERLKILQSLVPNGTKVDISTMLEEAFHYVKFLQLQIRLLSSDEHWMFAPLAYNGLDIGAYKRLSPFLG